MVPPVILYITLPIFVFLKKLFLSSFNTILKFIQLLKFIQFQ